MNDEARLQEILETNPFKSVVPAWKKTLESLRNAPLDEIQQHTFLLPEDEKRFADPKYTRTNSPTRLWKEIPPQPFIGNPRADIWYVQINPSFSWVDYYDYISINKELKKQIKSNLAEEARMLAKEKEKKRKKDQKEITKSIIDGLRLTENDFKMKFSGEIEIAMLDQRQKYLMSSIGINGDDFDFYPITECYDTISYPTPNLIGCRKWWEATLCRNNSQAIFGSSIGGGKPYAQSLGNQLFVLEFFPYHSASFDRANYTFPSGHPYRTFVTKLLTYAKDCKKALLFRSKKDFSNVGIEMDERVLIQKTSNPDAPAQRAYLTMNAYPALKCCSLGTV